MQKSFLLSIIILGISASSTFACSCVVSGTVDQEFRKAANVVLLKVRGVEKTEAPPPRLVNYGGIKQSRLTVEKIYKGNLKVGEELIFAQGGGADCIWTFTEEDIGTEFLFYLGIGPVESKTNDGVIAATGQFPKAVAKNVWVATTCSRSNSMKWAAADILYLDNRLKINGRTRLSGQITKRIESAIEEQPSSLEILPDFRVLITGNGRSINLKTDKNGVYEIYDLAPGKYNVRLETIDGYRSGTLQKSEGATVEVKAKSHTEQNFSYEIDSSIRGKFFDKNGKPLDGVCMDLVPAHGRKSQYFYKSDCTESDGSFELTEIPAGSYYLLFNDDDEVNSTTPFHAFYYPNVKEREKASEIQIAPGTKIENMIVTAPETAEVVTISGVLRMQDGKPANSKNVEYAAVEFIADDDIKASENSPSSRSSIDAYGRFTLRVLKGQKGKLYGTVSAYPGKYLKCPKLEKLIPKGDGFNIADIKTPELSIIATDNQIGLELTFPFPSCKLARVE